MQTHERRQQGWKSVSDKSGAKEEDSFGIEKWGGGAEKLEVPGLIPGLSILAA